MNDILGWGLDAIRLVQRASSPTLTAVLKGLSALGTEYFFLLALPLVYWCIDRRRGIRMGLLFFLSAFVNAWLKHLTMEPRPYELDASVGKAREATSAFPSFHAQSSAVFWGSAMPLFRPPWALLLALAVPLIVGFTRVYLGVHYPTDILAGWLLGLLFVAGERGFGDKLERLMGRQREQIRFAVVAALALAMNALDLRDTTVSGAFFGFGVGIVYARRVAPFTVDGALGQRILRFIVGSAGTVILFLGPKVLLASVEPSNPPLVHFVRYALVGFWAALGAPWLFLKLGLSAAEEGGSSGVEEGSHDRG